MMKFEIELTMLEQSRKRGFVIIEADTEEEAEQKYHDQVAKNDVNIEWEETDDRFDNGIVIDNVRKLGK